MYSTLNPTYPMGNGVDPASMSFAFKKPAAVGMMVNQFRPFKAPFSHSVGLIGSYTKAVLSNTAQYYLYNPGIWKKLIQTQTLQWPGIIGLRGFMGGEKAAREGAFMGVTGRVGAWVGRPARSAVAWGLKRVLNEKYAPGIEQFVKGGVKGFAEYMKGVTNSKAWGKIAKYATRASGSALKFGVKTSSVLGKVGSFSAMAAITYEAIRSIAWLGGSVVRTGMGILDKMSQSLRNMNSLRYKLPDGYRTPEAATMRSRALQEMQASRSNLRNVMLGNEAYYLHR